MKDETRAWIEQAREDFEAAKYNYEGELYKVAGFLCQQAVEKALKAYLLARKGEIRKIHDLVVLGREADVPREMIDKFKELTLAYVYARYPDVQGVKNIKGKVSKFLEITEEVLEWVEHKI